MKYAHKIEDHSRGWARQPTREGYCPYKIYSPWWDPESQDYKPHASLGIHHEPAATYSILHVTGDTQPSSVARA